MGKKKNLIIGVGNILLSDEGVGIHLIRELEKRDNLHDCLFIDLGTSSLDIEYYIDDDIEKIIILDCIKSSKYDAGSVFKLRPEDMIKVRGYDYSLHQLELIDSLRLASLTKDIPDTIVLGVIPETIDVFSEELSDVLKARFDDIVKKIEKEIMCFIGTDNA